MYLHVLRPFCCGGGGGGRLPLQIFHLPNHIISVVNFYDDFQSIYWQVSFFTLLRKCGGNVTTAWCRAVFDFIYYPCRWFYLITILPGFTWLLLTYQIKPSVHQENRPDRYEQIELSRFSPIHFFLSLEVASLFYDWPSLETSKVCLHFN